jgi:hypothetical protein
MPSERRCETCGGPYWRRNFVEVWTVRQEGARAGWVKRIVRQCLKCQPTALSIQLLRVMHVRVGVRGLASARRRRTA